MKRVKSACIFQTLIFSQKPEMGLSKERALRLNREEFERYVQGLERTKTRHQIVDKTETEDGSVIVKVRKQYNDTIDVSEYFA